MKRWMTRPDERRPRGRRSLWFDIAVAVFATGVEVGTVIAVVGAPSAFGIGLGFMGGAVVAVRRWAPVPVLAATVVPAITITAIGDVPAGFPVLVALYTVAAMCERRVALTALVPAVPVVAILSAIAPEAPGEPNPSALGAAISNTLITVGFWSLGAYIQTRRRSQREHEQRAEQLERERDQQAQIAVHEERAAIARELHDIVAHSVAVMLVGVRGARDVLRASPDVADDTLARVETSGEQSLVELRRILALLREPDHGAESRPQPSLAEIEELVAEYRAAGLPVRLEVSGDPQPLAGGIELSVYRIVQEALTNVLKHARPSSVIVSLAFRESRLEVEVVDDAPAAERGPAEPGHGILGMRERVALLGGELETGRRPSGGFRVAARLPVGGEG